MGLSNPGSILGRYEEGMLYFFRGYTSDALVHPGLRTSHSMDNGNNDYQCVLTRGIVLPALHM